MWTKEKIDNLLGSQKDFLESYCNLRTKDFPNTESCRKVIKRMIELMPNTDQQSPLWAVSCIFGCSVSDWLTDCIRKLLILGALYVE